MLLIVDEAYFEYVQDAGYPDSLAYHAADRAILTLRTFSKLYGLAGLRIGYGVGPKEMIALMQRVRQPFNVNAPAQWAALAALDDADHVRRSLDVNRQGIDYLRRSLPDSVWGSCRPGQFYFGARRQGTRSISRIAQPRCHRSAHGRLSISRACTGDSWHNGGKSKVYFGTEKSHQEFLGNWSAGNYMALMFQKMVMAGVGLICGSLALDMRRRKLVSEIVGYGRSESNLRLAKKNGIIDSYFLREDEFPASVDFLMMGTPVETIVPLTQAFLPKLEPGCIVSDVGSVKARSFAAWSGCCLKTYILLPAIRSPAANNGAPRRHGAISSSAIDVF